MFYHLRFTPYELPSDNLESIFQKFDKFIIAQEHRRKNGDKCAMHYHVFIESDLDIDTIRDYVVKKLAIPKVGKGRNNRYYMLKQWNDNIDYIIKQGNIIACKGFEMPELLARVPPDPVETSKEKNPSEQAAPAAAAKKKETNFWNEIVERAILWEKSTQKKVETESALILISKAYFSKGLPLPHPGDRKRWATSLVMYSKMRWEFNESAEHEKILEDEALRFQAEHIVSNIVV